MTELEEDDLFIGIYRHTYPDFLPQKNPTFLQHFLNESDQGKEAILVNQIFNNLLCIPSSLIYPKGYDKEHAFRLFSVDSKVPQKFIPIISECIETIKLHTFIQDSLQSVRNLQNGKVNQALAQCLNLLMLQYKKEITEIYKKHREESMTLVQMKQPLKKINFWLKELVRLLMEINTNFLTGGATFSYIHEELLKNAGNPERYELLKEIAVCVAKPFFEILNEWIFCGVLNDPKSEFFIQNIDKNELAHDITVNDDFSNISKDSLDKETDGSWVDRLIILHTQIPSFIDKQLAGVILKTGLYVKILGQCESRLDLHKEGLLTYSTESDDDYIQKIYGVYKKTSAFLLDFLVDKFQLYDHINSFKTFMLINQRDFITNFLDSTPELFQCYDPESLQLGSFQNHLESAIGQSSIAKDPLGKNLLVSMSPLTFLGEFVGIKKHASQEPKSELSALDCTPRTFAEAFVLDLKISWPITLVLNELVMNSSKLLFRHIFQCIITEYKLSSIWALTNSIRGSLSKYSSFFLPALILGENMIHFNNQYLMFINVFVIEPAFHDLHKKLKHAKTLEDVKTYVEECISACLHESLLRKDHLIGALANINELCSEFGDFIHTLLVNFEEGMAEVVQDPQNQPKSEAFAPSTLTSHDFTLPSNPLRRTSSINSLLSINTNTYQIGVPAKITTHQIFPPSLTQEEKRNLVELKRQVMEKTIDYYASLPEFHETVASFSARFVVHVNDLLQDLNLDYGKHCAKLKTLANLIDAKGFYAEAAKKVVEENGDLELTDAQSERVETFINPRDKNIFQSSFLKIEQECEKPLNSNVLPGLIRKRPGIGQLANEAKHLDNVSQWLSESRYSSNHDGFVDEENAA